MTAAQKWRFWISQNVLIDLEGELICRCVEVNVQKKRENKAFEGLQGYS